MRTATLFTYSMILLAAQVASTQVQKLDRKETFASAKLSAAEIHDIVSAVAQSAYDMPESWSKELLARRVDLGGTPGLVLQGTHLLCGGTGNCQIFVFQKKGAHWFPLFRDQAPIAEGFELGPGSSNGIKDFLVTSNSSADAVARIRYKFDGTEYKPVTREESSGRSQRN